MMSLGTGSSKPGDDSRLGTILLVDDDPRQRVAIAALLRFKGNTCIEAGNREEVANQLNKLGDRIDACLLDWHLGTADVGRATLKLIRKRFPLLPVLVFTAKEDAGRDAYAAGASFYITKPFEPGLVTHFVDALMTMRGLAQEVALTERQNQLLERANHLMSHLHCLAQDEPDQSEKQVASAVADFLHKELFYSRVRIYLMADGKPVGTVSRGMHDGFDIAKYSLEEDDPNALRAFDNGAPVLIAATELRDDRFFHEFRKEDVRFQMMVPLVSAFGESGLITIDDKDAAHPLSEDDVAVLSLASAAIAGALQAALERRQDVREKEWYRGLLEIDKVLSSTPRLDRVLQSVIDTLTGLVPADMGIVMTRRGEGLPLGVIAASEGAPPEIFRVTHDGNYGLIGKCLQIGEQVKVDDITSDSDFIECLQKIQFSHIWKQCFSNTRTVVIEPVCCGDVLIGVLILGFSQLEPIDQIDLKFLDDVARRVAIALAKLDEEQRFEAALIQKAKLSDLAMLTAGVSHGIRNPLQTIRAALDVMTDVNVSDKQGSTAEYQSFQEAISSIEQALKRAFDLVNRLVRWATPSGGLSGVVQVEDILRDLTEIVSGQLSEQKIVIELQIAEKLPPVDASIDGLRVAFDDLVWNAAKAMPHGGTLTITANCDRDTEAVEVRFTDTGMGMSQEQVDQLFSRKPFEPLPAGGSGLGTYLASKVVESAGGSVECQSEEGHGTTFTFRFPAMDDTSSNGVA